MSDILNIFKGSDATGAPLKENLSVKAFSAALQYVFLDTAYTGTFSLSHIPLFQQLDKLMLFSALEANTLPETVLDILAEQFSVHGWEYVGEYNVVTTIKDRKNEFLKQTMDLKRHRGTPFAVEKVLTNFGYTNIIIVENISVLAKYDGSIQYNGSMQYDDLKNQLFNVGITSDHDLNLKEETVVIRLINKYKKERPELYRLVVIEPSNPGGRTVQVW